MLHAETHFALSCNCAALCSSPEMISYNKSYLFEPGVPVSQMEMLIFIIVVLDVLAMLSENKIRRLWV